MTTYQQCATIINDTGYLTPLQASQFYLGVDGTNWPETAIPGSRVETSNTTDFISGYDYSNVITNAVSASRISRIVIVDPNQSHAANTIAEGIELAAALTPTPSSTNPAVILVGPGVYAEDGLVLPDWVALIGSGPHSTIIRKASTTYQEGYAATSALVSIPNNGHISGFTIENLRDSYTSMCLSMGYDPDLLATTSGKTITGNDLVLRGAAYDELALYGENQISLEYVDARDTGAQDTLSAAPFGDGVFRIRNSVFSAKTTCLWFSGTGTVYMDNCRFESIDGAKAIRWDTAIGSSTTVYFSQCVFENGVTASISGANGFTLNLLGCSYGELGVEVNTISVENLGDADKISGGDWTHSGTFSVQSTLSAGTVNTGSQGAITAGYSGNSHMKTELRPATITGSTPGSLRFTSVSGGLFAAYPQMIVYPSSATELTLGASGVNVNSLGGFSTSGTVRISSSGAGTLSSLTVNGDAQSGVNSGNVTLGTEAGNAFEIAGQVLNVKSIAAYSLLVNNTNASARPTIVALSALTVGNATTAGTANAVESVARAAIVSDAVADAATAAATGLSGGVASTETVKFMAVPDIGCDTGGDAAGAYNALAGIWIFTSSDHSAIKFLPWLTPGTVISHVHGTYIGGGIGSGGDGGAVQLIRKPVDTADGWTPVSGTASSTATGVTFDEITHAISGGHTVAAGYAYAVQFVAIIGDANVTVHELGITTTKRKQ